MRGTELVKVRVRAGGGQRGVHSGQGLSWGLGGEPCTMELELQAGTGPVGPAGSVNDFGLYSKASG